MRAQIGAIFLSGIILVACATNGTRQPYVHPKARKSVPATWEQPAQMPATAPKAPEVVAVPPVPVPPPAPTAQVSEPKRIVPAAPIAPPQRAPEKPSWNTPNVRPVAPIASAPAPASAPEGLLIRAPMAQVENRLPCNRGGSPFCELRIYQAYVATFVDGSQDHKPISGYGPGPHTGDIEGVIGALDHIKALGFNMVWLTPIFDSAAGQPQARVTGTNETNPRLDGTGYFPRDYFKIDPQFGTLDQARSLVEKAHSLGIKVMFDGVFGHNKGNVTASPSGARPIAALDPSAYSDAPQSYPGTIVDFSDARSTAFYKEVSRYWIDLLGIDGWRLDQVYQVPAAPLREINAEIRDASDAQLLSGYVVGEMWGTATQIRNVLGPTGAPSIASAFDFPTRYALTQVLAGDENGSQDKPATTINAPWAMGAHGGYPDHAIMNLMLGNHDLVRFGDLIERAGKGSPQTAGYWARHRMAFTFMAAWSGPITLYYGEEIGAEVAGFAAKVPSDCARLNQCDDHVARNMVSIGGVNARAGSTSAQGRALQDYLTSLMRLRAASPALSSGSRTHVFSDSSLYVDLKSDGTDRYLLVMNTGSTIRTFALTPGAIGQTVFQDATIAAGSANALATPSQLTLTLDGLSAAIIKVTGP